MLAGAGVQAADEDEDGAHASHADPVGGSVAEVGHDKEPADKRTEESHSSTANVEVVGLRRGQADLLEEVGRVVSKGNSAKNLANHAHARDFSAAQLEALEAVPV